MHKGFDERHASIAGMFGQYRVHPCTSKIELFLLQVRVSISPRILPNPISTSMGLEVGMGVPCIKINPVICAPGKTKRHLGFASITMDSILDKCYCAVSAWDGLSCSLAHRSWLTLPLAIILWSVVLPMAAWPIPNTWSIEANRLIQNTVLPITYWIQWTTRMINCIASSSSLFVFLFLWMCTKGTIDI